MLIEKKQLDGILPRRNNLAEEFFRQRRTAIDYILGPCAGLLVAAMYTISKYVDLANCTLKIHTFFAIHAYCIILQPASV